MGRQGKIGAIGIHVSRGVTTHGFAVNVDNDLQPFQWVVACGGEGTQASLAAQGDRPHRRDGVLLEAGRVARRPAVSAAASAWSRADRLGLTRKLVAA